MHELPKGKIQIFMVDLTLLPPEQFDKICGLLDRASYNLECVPGKQLLKVYWNYVEPISDVIGCSPEWVRPWP